MSCGCGCNESGPIKAKDLVEATTPSAEDYVILMQDGKAKKLYWADIIGASIPIISIGSGAPNDSNGSNNDIYIDSTNFIIYKKIAGTWVSQGNFAGEDGEDGVDGTDGSDGSNGVDGVGLEFTWVGTSLGVRRVGQVSYTSVDLKGDTGAAGPTGPTGTSFTWQGAWLTATVYAVNDVVENDGSSYICILAHTSDAASEAGTGVDTDDYWELMAEIGTDGSDGADGADGATFEVGSLMMMPTMAHGGWLLIDGGTSPAIGDLTPPPTGYSWYKKL